MLVNYAKQETIDPLKTLAKYLGLGFGGSVLVFLGFFFLSLGVLRGMQSVDTFEGVGLGSVVPYLVTMLVMALIVLLIWRATQRAVDKVEERQF